MSSETSGNLDFLPQNILYIPFKFVDLAEAIRDEEYYNFIFKKYKNAQERSEADREWRERADHRIEQLREWWRERRRRREQEDLP